jgi:hypothetical protein
MLLLLEHDVTYGGVQRYATRGPSESRVLLSPEEDPILQPAFTVLCHLLACPVPDGFALWPVFRLGLFLLHFALAAMEVTDAVIKALETGKYRYTVELMPKYGGAYNVNPANAEMMYFPVFYFRCFIAGKQ